MESNFWTRRSRGLTLDDFHTGPRAWGVAQRCPISAGTQSNALFPQRDSSRARRPRRRRGGASRSTSRRRPPARSLGRQVAMQHSYRRCRRPPPRLSASVFPISAVINLASCWRLPARAAQAFHELRPLRGVVSRSRTVGPCAPPRRRRRSPAGVETLTRWMTAPVAGFVSTIWPCSMATPWTIVSYDGRSCRRPCAGLAPRGWLFLSEVLTASRSRGPSRGRAKVKRRSCTVGVGDGLCARHYCSGAHARRARVWDVSRPRGTDVQQQLSPESRLENAVAVERCV